ncbi:MAG TPA: hypothetical protein VEQ85_06910, partial [Lacipirellulaceae bacterium]|nr:hypothetical protein [Lacipirellulaceae bacterium]
MRRPLSAVSMLFALVLAAVGLVLQANPAAAQGFLVVPHPGPHWRLPRPIPGPEPRPQPQSSYRIASLEVNARIRDAVATV